MTRIFMALATGFAIGRLPRAGKTIASIAALLPWLLIKDLPLQHYLTMLAILCVVGFFSSGAAEKIVDVPDADTIVIDEIVGMLVALTLIPQHLPAIVTAVALFLLFDAFKPWPIGWIDKHIQGGIGIMLDDVAAGIYTFCCLQLLFLIAKTAL